MFLGSLGFLGLAGGSWRRGGAGKPWPARSGRPLHTLAKHASPTIGAVAIARAGIAGHALVAAADLEGWAASVVHALRASLADTANAQLAGAAVHVEPAGARGGVLLAEAKVALAPRGAVLVALALGRREGVAGTTVAGLALGTVAVGATAAGLHAGLVEALGGGGAVGLALAVGLRGAARPDAAIAHLAGLTGRAALGLAVALLAALVVGALAVPLAILAWTAGAGKALGVQGAGLIALAGEVATAGLADAGLVRGAVGGGAAQGHGQALGAEGVAALAGGALAILPAVAHGRAHPLQALLAAGAVLTRGALTLVGGALAAEAHKGLGAVLVLSALGVGVDTALACEADLAGGAVGIGLAAGRGHALLVDTAVALGTLGVRGALAHGLALVVEAAIAWGAVAVHGARGAGDAEAELADLPRAALQVRAALRGRQRKALATKAARQKRALGV